VKMKDMEFAKDLIMMGAERTGLPVRQVMLAAECASVVRIHFLWEATLVSPPPSVPD
jgi:hypothetical protein